MLFSDNKKQKASSKEFTGAISKLPPSNSVGDTASSPLQKQSDDDIPLQISKRRSNISKRKKQALISSDEDKPSPQKSKRGKSQPGKRKGSDTDFDLSDMYDDDSENVSDGADAQSPIIHRRLRRDGKPFQGLDRLIEKTGKSQGNAKAEKSATHIDSSVIRANSSSSSKYSLKRGRSKY